jgi:hypothetical protein
MITALTTADVKGDGWEDIVLAGEYMPITVLMSDKGAFGKATQKTTLPQTEGLWNCIEKADLDGDGDMDFVLGNLGQNHFFREGLTTFVGDFDENGNMEQVSTRVAEGQHYPIHDIDELYMQMPILKKKYRTYKEFAQAPWEVLVPEGLRQAALLLQLVESRSVVLWNNGGELTPMPLPRQAQYSTVNAVAITDVDADGTPDLLLGGNDYKCKPQFGRQDASFGWVCHGENRGGNVTFATCQPLGIAGQVRALELLDHNKIIVGINDGKIDVYERD